MILMHSTLNAIYGGPTTSLRSTNTVVGRHAKIPRTNFLRNKKTPYRKTSVLRTRAIVEVSDENFETEVLKSDCPVLVDFWAEWCGPCKLIDKIIYKVEEKYAESLKVVKLNIEPSPGIVEKYKIYGLPTIMLFENGSYIAESKREGVLTFDELEKYLADFGIMKINGNNV